MNRIIQYVFISHLLIDFIDIYNLNEPKLIEDIYRMI